MDMTMKKPRNELLAKCEKKYPSEKAESRTGAASSGSWNPAQIITLSVKAFSVNVPGSKTRFKGIFAQKQIISALSEVEQKISATEFSSQKNLLHN